MNARAACRLETLGFDEVYRYAPGKADWRAAGLPMEVSEAPKLRAKDAVRSEAPACDLEATVATARQRAQGAGVSYCLVVSATSVVLGRVRGSGLQAQPDVPVSDVMEEGPTTTRADDDLEQLVGRMARAGVATIVVTDPDGMLIGVVHREDAEERIGANDEG